MSTPKGTATTSSARRRNRSRPAGNARRLDLILWVGIGVVCAIFLGNMMFGSSDLFIKKHELSSDKLVNDASQPEGMVDVAFCLAHPSEQQKLACRYLDLLPKLDSEEFREKLAAAVLDADENVLLPSLALCVLDDARGMPGIIRMLEAEDPYSATYEIRDANLFSDEFASENPLYRNYQTASDIQLLIAMVESTLVHNFPGKNTHDRRKHILEWWTDNSAKTMLQWQIDFLRSENKNNRSAAFQKVSRLAWNNKDLAPHLLMAMETEPDNTLRNQMVTELFRLGIPDSLPAFDEYVTNATHPDDIAHILAIVSLKVALPNKFKQIDQWNGGNRNDEAAFDFFSNWWVENRNFLTYYRQRWRVRKPGQDNPESGEPSADNELEKDPRKQFME